MPNPHAITLLLEPGDAPQQRLAAALRLDWPDAVVRSWREVVGVKRTDEEPGLFLALVHFAADAAPDLEPLRALRAARPGTAVIITLPETDWADLLAVLPQELDYYPVSAGTDEDTVRLLAKTVIWRQELVAPSFLPHGKQSHTAVAELRRSHGAFRELHEITADAGLDFRDKLKAVLHLGLRYFGLHMGIVSRIAGESYEIFESAAANGDAPPPGTLFRLAETYCERTISADVPVGFEHAARSEWHRHPAYHLLRLEAYIGVPVRVGDRLFGTLNFSSPEPAPGVFRPLNVELLKVMGRWVGAEILRQEHESSLRRINADLEEFAYVASHDLKAPLRAVANLAYWIDEDLGGSLDETNRERLRLLRERVIQMDRLINSLLDYSRVGWADPMAYPPVALGPIVAELLREQPPPGGFRIEVREPLPSLRADPQHLRRIFRNLIDNAVLHHDRDSGQVVIRGAEVGNFWSLEVADDGPGIPPESRESVFKMFATLQPKTGGGHSGIGLALVRKLVLGYGGQVAVTANRPRGSVFRILWPKTAS